MDQVMNRIMESGTAPTRQDIADLLVAIAPPGERREEKDAKVRELFDAAGHPHTNFQGHSILDALDGFGAY